MTFHIALQCVRATVGSQQWTLWTNTEWDGRSRLQVSCLCEPFQKPTHPLISLGQQVAHGVNLVRSSTRKGNPDAEKKGNKRKQQLWASNHVLLSATITHSNIKDLAPLASVWLRENCCDSTAPGKHWWPTADGRKHFYGVYCFSKAGRKPPPCIPLLL